MAVFIKSMNGSLNFDLLFIWGAIFMIKKINEFIELGLKVKEENYQRVTEPGLIIPNYISGELYDSWMNKIKIFADRYLSEHSLYDEIINSYNARNTSWGTTSYDDMISYLRVIREDEEFLSLNNTEKDTHQEKMLFISHSSLDIEYVTLLVKILEDIGFRSKSLLFCSSLSGYHIPNGKHIYDFLKKQFDKELHVIFLLSENYYNSTACLNEMGAAWVKSIDYTAILTPEFNHSQIEGVIGTSNIWFKMNEKFRLNELKDKLIQEFDLNQLELNYWERRRDEYLTNLEKLVATNKYKHNPHKVDVEDMDTDGKTLYIYVRFINNSSRTLRCKFLRITLEHEVNPIIINIPKKELENYIIYSGENRRINFKVEDDVYSSIDNLQLSQYKVTTRSEWTHIID